MEGEAVKVEDLALQHYAAEEHGSWQGLPTELLTVSCHDTLRHSALLI